MNEEQKKKYQLLKEKNQKMVKEFAWKDNVLFQECVEALGECKVLSTEETDKIADMLQKNFPFRYGTIDWNSLPDSIEIKQEELTLKFNRTTSYYILWDNGSVPFLLAEFGKITDAMDDVLAVDFNTWLLSLDGKEVIEFRHEHEENNTYTITYGRNV